MRSLDDIIRGSFVSLDVEGDGNNPNRPVELSILTVEKGIVVDEANWLINPGVPITPFVTGLHGIGDKDVKDAPLFAEIAAEVRRRIEGANIVAHAPKSDLAMLRTGIPDVDFLPAQVIDTQRLAKFLLPDLKRYGLDNIISVLGLEHDVTGPRSGHHTARHDAVMAARIFLDLVPRIPTPKQMVHLTRMATVTLSPHEERRLREVLASLQEIGKLPSLGS
jgi:DNA polymerase III epsilon subunit-like protein